MSNILIVFLILALLIIIKYKLEKSNSQILVVRDEVVTILLEETPLFRRRQQTPMAHLRKKLRKQRMKERELNPKLIVIIVATTQFLAIIVFLFRLRIECKCVFIIGKNSCHYLKSYLRHRRNFLYVKHIEIKIFNLIIFVIIFRNCFMILKITLEILKKLIFSLINISYKIISKFIIILFLKYKINYFE
jgi:hypothetical protein